jgi:hypothetical protein
LQGGIPKAFDRMMLSHARVNQGHLMSQSIDCQLREAWFAPTPPAPEAVLTQERVEAQDWSGLPIADDSEWVW